MGGERPNTHLDLGRWGCGIGSDWICSNQALDAGCSSGAPDMVLVLHMDDGHIAPFDLVAAQLMQMVYSAMKTAFYHGAHVCHKPAGEEVQISVHR